ncbi:TonB-dependent receptor plug domain-containing protein [Bacteroidota bacterium]
MEFLRRGFLPALMIMYFTSVWAQETEIKDSLSLEDYYDMSLDEMDSIKASGISSELEAYINSLLSISTNTSLSARNSPSVVSFITKEDIKNSGARDLIDVLRTIPGFHFALDEQGQIGLGVRGNWTNEGKVLLMIDGIEMNEIYTARIYFGNHYPVDLIQRIEIIRGPGSAIYGGFAEYGVINIVTKSALDHSGISVGVNYGHMTNTLGRVNPMFYIGKAWKKVSFSISTFQGTGNRSDQPHYGFYRRQDSLGIGAHSSLTGNSTLSPSFNTLKFQWGNFKFTSINDLYEVTNIDSIDANNDRFIKQAIKASYNEFSYLFDISERFNLKARLQTNHQYPTIERSGFRIPEPEAAKNYQYRTRLNLFANFYASHRINFLAGFDIYRDFAKASTEGLFHVGPKDVSYTNVAFFWQQYIKLPDFNLLVGGRVERNSAYRASFVPRLGLTRKFEKLHMKFLLNDAFRAPTIGNVANSFGGFSLDSTSVMKGSILPERILMLEYEMGYKLNRNMHIQGNFFSISARNPIVYNIYANPPADVWLNYYQNFKRSSTIGAEFEFRFREDWGYLDINYSYYSIRNRPRVHIYEVRLFDWNASNRDLVDPKQLLAFPRHKANFSFCYYFNKNITGTLTATLFGPRYYYDVLLGDDVYDDGGNLILPREYNVFGQLKKTNTQTLINFFVRYRDLFTEGLEFGGGVYNLMNTHYEFHQPYFGIKPPVPGPSREIYFKLAYSLNFKKKEKKDTGN